MTSAFSKDYNLINVATTILGLKHPVAVHIPDFLPNWSGYYHGIMEAENGALLHSIQLNPFLSAKNSSLVLWHELGHAQQREDHETNEEFLAELAEHKDAYEEECWQVAQEYANIRITKKRRISPLANTFHYLTGRYCYPYEMRDYLAD